MFDYTYHNTLERLALGYSLVVVAASLGRVVEPERSTTPYTLQLLALEQVF